MMTERQTATDKPKPMKTYTYSVFDGDPAVSGPCAWPEWEDLTIRGRNLDTVSAHIERLIARELRDSCGTAYQAGDELYYLIYDGSGVAARGALVVREKWTR